MVSVEKADTLTTLNERLDLNNPFHGGILSPVLQLILGKSQNLCIPQFPPQ